MKSIQNQYNQLIEGSISQANFMRNVRMTFPHLVSNVTNFEDSVKILRNKGLLSEAKKDEGHLCNPVEVDLGLKVEVAKHEGDVEKAKKLLAEAGYPKGFETELWTLPVSRPYLPNGKKLGELMQADLAKIGVKVKLVTFDWPVYLEKSKKGEHQMIQMGWTGDNGDPDNFMNILLGCGAIKAGSNLSRWCDQEFDTLLQKAKEDSNQAVRTGFYQKAQAIFNQQKPWYPIAHAKLNKVISDKVTGYKIDPFGHENFSSVDLK
jgi:dipeptide transport system substrate-binding protein